MQHLKSSQDDRWCWSSGSVVALDADNDDGLTTI
jgi:hypothetical protein